MTMAIRLLSVINAIQLGAFRWGAMFLVLAIAAIVAAGVFFRYALNDSLSWSEELAKYAMLWLFSLVLRLLFVSALIRTSKLSFRGFRQS